MVVFLDFDGVLINARSLRERRPLSHRADPDCVAALNHITNTTGAHIVISSAWRLDYSREELAELLLSWGVTGQFVGLTPAFGYGTERGDEIGAWMLAESVPNQNIVILDDDQEMLALTPRLVRTNSDIGLTMDHALAGIALLHRSSAQELGEPFGTEGPPEESAQF